MPVSVGAQEIELKLSLPPGAVRRLAAHPLMRGSRARARRLRTVYYDTPEHELMRRGVALRVRRDGTRWVQTVKGGGNAEGGLHRRLEFEHALARPGVDWRMLAGGPFAGLFASRRLRARLQPVFATRFVRTERRLTPRRGVVIDAAVDRGEITSGGRRQPLCELELELKAGPPAALYEVALALARSVPLEIENRSKAERGYALSRAEAERPVKARTVELDPPMTLAAVFEAVAWAALDHLQANRAGMLAGRDPEFLHQMRVALRRMRSVFRVFAPVIPKRAAASLVAEMRWLAGALGPARDWDVFVAETLPQLVPRIRTRTVRGAVERAAQQRRREANRRARRAVDSGRYRRFTLSLAAWLAARQWVRRRAVSVVSAPARGFTSGVLERHRAKVLKRGRGLAAQSPARRHRLRIAIKRLRYAGDFFSGLYASGRARRSLRQLSRLQDILGAMNDAAAAAAMLSECCKRLPESARAEAERALGAWARSRRPALERALGRAWKAHSARRKFW